MGYLFAGLLVFWVPARCNTLSLLFLLAQEVHSKVADCLVKIKGKPVVSVWSFQPCSIRDDNPINPSKSEIIRANPSIIEHNQAYINTINHDEISAHRNQSHHDTR